MNAISPNVARRSIWRIGRLLAPLALCLGLSWSVPAAAQVEVTPVPTRFTPGARIKVVSEGLAVSSNYRLRLEEPRPGTRTWVLAEFASGSATRVTTAVSVPEVAPGPYELTLYRVQIGATQVAAAAVQVNSPLSVALTPASTRQGKSVQVAVGGLSSGTVRVKFAGGPVIGPVAVRGGSWNGKFVVPRDRPASVPATVAVVVENMVGGIVVGTGSANLQVQASNGLPALGASLSQVPTGVVPRGGALQMRGRLQTDDGVAPAGRQQAYWRAPGQRIVPLDDQLVIAADGTFTLGGRAPDMFLDGLAMLGSTSGRGELVIVAQGNNADTGRPGDRVATMDTPQFVQIDARDQIAPVAFTVVVRGDGPGADDPPLSNVYVEVGAEWRSAFTRADTAPRFPGGPVVTEVARYNEEELFNATRPNQMSAGFRRGGIPGGVSPRDGFGCDVTYYRKRTDDQGRALFLVSPEVLVNTNQVSPCEVNINCRGGLSGLMSFRLDIFAGHRGYRSTGIAVEFDEDTGEFIDQVTGQPFPNNRAEVRLERMQTQDFDLRNLRIDGLGYQKDAQCPLGASPPCAYSPTWFGTMYTYPDTTLWPSSGPDNVFTTLNSERKMRLNVDPSLFGGLTFGRVRIGNLPWSSFDVSPTPSACLLEEEGGSVPMVDHVATLPDLTRLPVAPVTVSGTTASGGIDGVIELRFGLAPLRTIPFKIATQRPPTGIDDTNPRIRTLQIDAREDKINGTYNVPSPEILVGGPGYGIGRLDNRSRNASGFEFVRTPDSIADQSIDANSDNQVAGVEGGSRAAESEYFGFTNSNHTTPDPVVLFDTGLIPLFRYSFGLPPIASATMGADFWMAADLAFYGRLKPAGMDATIDPTVAGGVNLFFDLDVLLGLASASIAAESQIDVTLRSVVGLGGLPGQQSGECFTFGLDAVWEACAVGICEGGREELIREPEDGSCSNIAANGFTPAQGGSLTDALQFDLPRPRGTATALATDGRGNSIALELDRAGALVATHMSGGNPVATRVLATRPVAVQHLALAFHATNRAVAVWSENRLTETAVRTLMETQRGRAFDDIVRTQRLRWSAWDGRAWTTPADLTSDGSDGKPQLAGCAPPVRFTTSGCRSGGEIVAVWERDANRNLDAPDIEVWSATWTPSGGWRAVSRVSEPGASSDMLPSVAYRNDTPIVAWAHNPAGHFAQLSGRRVAYRFLDGSPMVRADALGSGVGWVSIGVSAADAVVIAYTRAQDSQGFVGNRQALFAARATTCGTGNCTFLVTEPRDEAGRQYRVERPRVTFDDDDTPIIGFRAVAFGAGGNGEAGLPGDLPGTLLGTGELGLVRVHNFALPRYTARFVPLSNDGLAHWKPEVVYDPSIGAVLALSTPSVAPAQAAASAPMRVALAYAPEAHRERSAALALSGGAEMRTLGGGPDFVIRGVSSSRPVIAAGQSTVLRFELANAGGAYDPAAHGSVRVTTSWDAPGGAGVAGPTFILDGSLASNAGRAVALTVVAPSGIRNDERQTLFIEVDAGEFANAVGGEADREFVEFNALPVPQGVNAQSSPGKPLVSLGWMSTNDTRVVGWRVWKLATNGAWRHLGSSPVAGYMDVRATPGEAAQYRVAAYSSNGIESEPSDPAYVFIEVERAEAVFRDGFEAPAP